MNQSEFNFLVTNILAIKDQLFSINCAQFATDVRPQNDEDKASDAFDVNNYINRSNYDEFINQGYESIASLSNELTSAWEKTGADILDELLNNVPHSLPVLTAKITSNEFKTCLLFSLENTDRNPLNDIHQYLTGFLNSNFDEVADIIREAIAFDDVTGLIEMEAVIDTSKITLDDLVTAVTIQSYSAFKWLFSHAMLSDHKLLDLFVEGMSDNNVFEAMYNIIKPSDKHHALLLSLAEKHSNHEAVNFLRNVNGSNK